MIPAVWFPFIFNLLLQIFDGLLSYHVSEGVPQANPFVSRAVKDGLDDATRIRSALAGLKESAIVKTISKDNDPWSRNVMSS